MPLDHRVQRRAERPQVRRGTGDPAPGPLRRDVRGRADQHPGGGHRGVALHPGDAEVGQHHSSVVADQHIGRLDVAVQDARAVRLGQDAQQVQADLRGPARGQHPVLADHLAQRTGLDQLHHDPRPVVLLDHVVDGDGGGVPDPGDRLGLGEGAGHQPAPLVLVHTGREPQLLHRDVAAQHLVLGPPDRAHAALPEHGRQPVAAREQPPGRPVALPGLLAGLLPGPPGADAPGPGRPHRRGLLDRRLLGRRLLGRRLLGGRLLRRRLLGPGLLGVRLLSARLLSARLLGAELLGPGLLGHGLLGTGTLVGHPDEVPSTFGTYVPILPYPNGTMSCAPSRAASAVRSSGWVCDSRSASTRFR